MCRPAGSVGLSGAGLPQLESDISPKFVSDHCTTPKTVESEYIRMSEEIDLSQFDDIADRAERAKAKAAAIRALV